MVERSVSPSRSFNDMVSYIKSVREAFYDEPAKYEEFVIALNEWKAMRMDLSSVIARVEELMKDRRDLLLGFSVFLPAGAKITIPPEAKRTVPPEAKRTVPPKYEHTITKRDVENFMNKLKTRFCSIDTHVEGSFRAIMRMSKEGKMSENEVHNKVINLLYYHEDLIGDYFRFFTKYDRVALESLLLRFYREEMYS